MSSEGGNDFNRFCRILGCRERIENGSRGIGFVLQTKLNVLKCGMNELVVAISESEGSIVNGRSMSEDELG